MYLSNRLAVASVLLIAAVPLSTLAFIDQSERFEKEQQFSTAVEQAAGQYQAGAWLQSNRKKNEERAQSKEQEMQRIMRDKREVRLHIAAVRNTIERLKTVYGIDVYDDEAVQTALAQERENVKEFLRYMNAKNLFMVAVTPDDSNAFLRGVIDESLGEAVERDLRQKVLTQARQQMFEFVFDAEHLPEDLALLEEHHEELLAEYRKVEKEHNYYQSLVLTDDQLKAIREEVEQVHQEVLRMQSELARIDARVRRQAERALIEKGLRSAQPDSYSTGEVSVGPQFSVPVYGTVSAGFHAKGYEDYFGVPHQGMDIVVPQGSQVFSAADGVVFLARDGGAKGYSYVLIGHRGGYATLYGHLSQISVVNGQDISQGEVIGYSGGTPGTYGAGLMTTGPHLHFEVIKQGVNIDPKTVLSL